jgi:hypothetical protein
MLESQRDYMEQENLPGAVPCQFRCNRRRLDRMFIEIDWVHNALVQKGHLRHFLAFN